MHVGDVVTELVRGEVRCAVEVEPEPGPCASFRLVVAVPREIVGVLDVRPDAFAPLAAAICGAPPPDVEDRTAQAGPGWVGLAYDASAAAAAALLEPPSPVSHLVVLAELDGDTEPDRRMLGIAAVAAEWGLGVVRVATNARALASDRGCAEHLDGALWSAVTRVLPGFAQIVVPRPAPDAIAIVARDPRLLRHVVVCTEPDAPPNCGRCAACVHALTRLGIAGVEPPDGLFERPLTDEAVLASVDTDALDDLLSIVAEIPNDRAALQGLWAGALASRLQGRGDARWSPPSVVRLARARARSGARIPDDVTFGWEPGAVPLRLEHDARHRTVRALAARHERPVSWAMLHASSDGAGAARCAAQLTARWGRGVLWGYGPGGSGDRELLARTLRSARVRVWWRDAGGLDAARVLDTIEHGCLPLQAMPPRAADLARQALPERLRGLVLGVDDLGPERLADDEIDRRLHDAVAELVAGSLERDLLVAAGPGAGDGS